MKKAVTYISLAILSVLSSSLYAGDAAAGKTVYMQCSACHGQNGEGNQGMKAPKLAGQQAWYIVSSLQKFKSGKRGEGDPDAASMKAFASMLNDTQMADVAAYLESL